MHALGHYLLLVASYLRIDVDKLLRVRIRYGLYSVALSAKLYRLCRLHSSLCLMTDCED
jgi:hypothetical protein